MGWRVEFARLKASAMSLDALPAMSTSRFFFALLQRDLAWASLTLWAGLSMCVSPTLTPNYLMARGEKNSTSTNSGQ